MRTASKEFRNDNIKPEFYISIVLADGTELDELTNKNIYSGGIEISEKTSSDSSFDIGACLGRQSIIRVINENDILSEYDFANAQVSISAKKRIDTVTETIRLGKYIIDLPEFSGSTLVLNCVDRMVLFNRKIGSDIISGTTAATIVNSMCTNLGLALSTQRFAGWDIPITLPNDASQMTYIKLLSYICQITCNFARINDLGQLEIKWYDTSVFDGLNQIDAGDFSKWNNEYIDGGDFETYQAEDIYEAGDFDFKYHHFYANKSEKIITEDVVITGIKVKNDDIEVMYGEEGYVLVIEDNPLSKGKESVYAENIGLRCIGMRFRPFNISTKSNLLVEAGDACIVTDRKSNSYYSYVTSSTYKVGTCQNIACNAESPIVNSADNFSLVTEAVIKARKETEQKITAYDIAIQQLTDLMANSFGVYKTSEIQENGSYIYYMHNAPSLEESTIIWKMTADAFAVSSDGGKTWNAGFDSQGNAVVNVLNAIGINADWINAGSIKGRAINNGNGTFQVDEEGNVVANSFKSNSATITGGTIYIDTDDASRQLIKLSTEIHSASIQPNSIGINTEENEYLQAGQTYMGHNGFYVNEKEGNGMTSIIQLNKHGFNIPTIPISCKSVTQSSDAKLKREKQNINEEKKLIDLIKPVTYKFKRKIDKSGKRHIGIYAQDLLEAMKSLGLKNDEYALVEKGENGFYSINYIELIPLLIEVIKDMKQRIEVLENGNNFRKNETKKW